MVEATQKIILDNIFDVQAIIDNSHWQPLRAGVDIAIVYDDAPDGSRTAFLKYEAGASVPRHLHVSFEHIIILDGSQSDGTTEFTPGMVVIHGPGTEHAISSASGCLALAIWQKPVRFLE